jgi:hypothetical protein
MFAHRFRTRAAAVVGRRPARSAHRFAAHRLVPLLAAATAALLAGCSQMPQRLAGPDPSDPSAPARAAAYRSVIAPYASQRPVEPSPWRDQIDRINPAPKP